jgi:hypothetical protein
MSQPPLTKDQMQEAIDTVAKHGFETKAALALNIPRETLRGRIREAQRRGMKVSQGIEDLNNVEHLKAKLKRVETALRDADKHQLDHAIIKNKIIELTKNVSDIETPGWALRPSSQSDHPGTPTLMVSDLHWGERVYPKQINGVNEYNVEIARTRLKRLAERTIRLLGIVSPKFQYPGLVMPLGGDLVSGNIHDELVATNELSSIPAVLDLFESLGGLITTMLTRFDRIFIPCVTGNHGRDTRKIWAKDRHSTSFDWLICCFLAKHFSQDSRVTFLIPDGSDAYYKIYDHRYGLTHGDQFRGGDGVIGPLGPIIRGDHRKRSRNSQIDLDYDTLIMGHFHSHMQLTRLIVNGSLKGYDEYAYQGNFPYEPPQQALWLTHPKYHITYRMPVQVDTPGTSAKTNWVSISK